MTTESAPGSESEGMHVTFGSVVVLIATLGFGALLGGCLAHLVRPGAELSLLIGSGIFPTLLLGGGLLVEELWFLRLWQHQPHRYQLSMADATASPAVDAERQRSAFFLPLGFVVGAMGGVAVGMAAPGESVVMPVVLYALAGLGFGGIVYSLVQFSLLPSLGHAASALQTPSPPKRLHHFRPRYDEGRPEF
jgi:hypothetical protein